MPRAGGAYVCTRFRFLSCCATRCTWLNPHIPFFFAPCTLSTLLQQMKAEFDKNDADVDLSDESRWEDIHCVRYSFDGRYVSAHARGSLGMFAEAVRSSW